MVNANIVLSKQIISLSVATKTSRHAKAFPLSPAAGHPPFPFRKKQGMVLNRSRGQGGTLLLNIPVVRLVLLAPCLAKPAASSQHFPSADRLMPHSNHHKGGSHSAWRHSGRASLRFPSCRLLR